MDTGDTNISPTLEPRASTSSSIALGLLTAIVYVAGFAMVAAWFALLVIGQPGSGQAPRAPATCSVCGVVERVGEFERASLRISGDQSEGFVVLLAALSGNLERGTAPGKFYETAVLHDDGSVRIVRDYRAPRWQRGDRVKVIKGRIEPGELRQARAVSAGPTDAPSAAALAASPAERTPSPAQPVARAP
jgi:hypothetical protein